MGLFDRVVPDAKQKSGGQVIEEDLMMSVNDLEGEEWRDIAGFEDSYEVSNLGRVRSKERIASNGSHLSPKIRKGVGSRYRTISLCKENKGINKLIHRLVAEAFIPNPDNLPEVNHKDLDITNNRVDNLEWVSTSYNHMHGIKNKSEKKSYRRQVKCLETQEIFASISAAGRSVNADATQIIESIEAKRCCKGMTFIYADATLDDESSYLANAHANYQDFHRRPNMKNAKKLIAIETSQEFDSIATAARFFNCDTATIRNRVKAAKSFNGVTLKFIEEEEEKQ